MKMNCLSLSGLSLVLAFGLIGCSSESDPAVVGGYSSSEVSDEQVQAAAQFAVKAQTRREIQIGKIELVKVLSSEQQVVAGLNYRLQLQVRQNGHLREAEAVVWWQAWRKSEPYQLTSWTWKKK